MTDLPITRAVTRDKGKAKSKGGEAGSADGQTPA